MTTRTSSLSIPSIIFGLCAEAVFRPFPRLSAKHPDFLEKFDRDYRQKAAVIIEDASVCPAKLTSMESVLDLCDSSGEVRVYGIGDNSTDAGSHWEIGLMHPGTTTLGEYVNGMLQGIYNEPTYLFSEDFHTHCPRALESLQVPAVIVGSGVSEFTCSTRSCNRQDLELHTSSAKYYLNSGNFKSFLHNDREHRNFYVSMCSGDKHWMVINNLDVLKHKDELKRYMSQEGFVYKNKKKGAEVIFESWLLGEFPTWTEDVFLDELDVPVYNGVIKPGEILYGPAGSPHSAKSMQELSVMAKISDYEFEEFEMLDAACGDKTSLQRKKNAPKQMKQFCETHFRRKCGRKDMLNAVRNGRKANLTKLERIDTPFAEFKGCSTKKKICEVMGRLKFNQDMTLTWTSNAWRDYCADQDLGLNGKQEI